MENRYQYEGHVKVVVVIEIIFQVLFTIGCLNFIGVLFFATDLLLDQARYHEHSASSANHEVIEATRFLTVYAAFIVVLVILHAWLVHLIISGHEKSDPQCLYLWCVIQCVLIVLLVIFTASVAFKRHFVWLLVLKPIFFYRIYSVYAVRGHAKEIKEVSSNHVGFPV